MFIATRNDDGLQPARSGVSIPRRLRTLHTPDAWELAQRAVALALLVFLLPVMLLIGMLVAMHDGGPMLFQHQRIGLGGRSFGCLKFRTMSIDAQAKLADLLARDETARREWAQDQKLRRDPRITPLGQVLRKTSLDELPQLINVLRGDMNLVGPRPIVESEIARYGRRFRSYGSVKPGITGLWQISGRNDVAYGTRVALDSLYAQRRSPALDMWILLKTVPAVLLRHGSC